MNHITVWLCLIIMGNYQTNIFMHKALTDTKYCVQTQYYAILGFWTFFRLGFTIYKISAGKCDAK